MASGSQTLTTYYAKRIIGDSAAATAAKALLQTGDNVTTDLWLLHRSNRGTSLYGILYKYDGTNGHDKLQVYGTSNVTAWVQLDTGDTYLAGKVGIGYDPNTSGNTYKLYVDGGTSYFDDNFYLNGQLGIGYNPDTNGNTYKLYVNGTSYFTGQIEGADGIILPWIELSSATPYIDWHFGSSTADYTSRIIESSSGYLEVNAKLGINGSNTSYNFYVNGTSYLNGNTTHNGIVYFANGTTYYIDNSGTASLNDTTIAGTLYLTRTTDAEATADNRPALLIGPYNGDHLEFDGNEIMAKGSATTTSTLYLNNNGGQTYFGGDISCASTLTVRAENTTTEGGQICLVADPNHSSYAAYLDVCNNYFRVHSDGQERFTVNLSSYGTSSFNGLVQITKNSNTVTIGSANANWCHFENSADIPFYFNKAVHVNGDVYYYNTEVHMSSSGFHPPKNGGIYWDPYVESDSDASDVTSIYQITSGVAGGTELRINQQDDAADCINLCTNAYIYLNSKRAFTINDSWLRINENAGFSSGTYFGATTVRTDGTLQVGSAGANFYANSSGNGYFSNSLTISSRYYFGTGDMPEGAANLSAAAGQHSIHFYRNGFAIPYQMDNANDGGIFRVRGTSESTCICEIGTWDDSGAGETIQFNYYPTTSQITPTYSVSVPKASGTICLTNGTGASGSWGISVTGSSASCTGNAATATHATTFGSAAACKVYFHNSDECNFGGTNTSANLYFNYRATGDGRPIPTNFVFGGSGGSATIKAGKVLNAVWNDFAEFREVDTDEPGRVVIPTNSGVSTKSSNRLQPNGRIISDTYGCAVGESETARTPLGMAGRVLAYPYRSIDEYQIGDCVCTAPNGTVDIMTREEIKEWPDRIIGIVNEIPSYEIWEQKLIGHDTNKSDAAEHATIQRVQVNGRIWIDVK